MTSFLAIAVPDANTGSLDTSAWRGSKSEKKLRDKLLQIAVT